MLLARLKHLALSSLLLGMQQMGVDTVREQHLTIHIKFEFPSLPCQGMHAAPTVIVVMLVYPADGCACKFSIPPVRTSVPVKTFMLQLMSLIIVDVVSLEHGLCSSQLGCS